MCKGLNSNSIGVHFLLYWYLMVHMYLICFSIYARERGVNLVFKFMLKITHFIFNPYIIPNFYTYNETSSYKQNKSFKPWLGTKQNDTQNKKLTQICENQEKLGHKKGVPEKASPLCLKTKRTPDCKPIFRSYLCHSHADRYTTSIISPSAFSIYSFYHHT